MNPQRTIDEMIADFETAYGHHFTKRERQDVEGAIKTDAKELSSPIGALDRSGSNRPPMPSPSQDEAGYLRALRERTGVGRIEDNPDFQARNPGPRREAFASPRAPRPEFGDGRSLPSDIAYDRAQRASLDAGVHPALAHRHGQFASALPAALADPGAIAGDAMGRGFAKGDAWQIATGAGLAGLALVGGPASRMVTSAPRMAGVVVGGGGLTYANNAFAEMNGPGVGTSQNSSLPLALAAAVPVAAGYKYRADPIKAISGSALGGMTVAQASGGDAETTAALGVGSGLMAGLGVAGGRGVDRMRGPGPAPAPRNTPNSYIGPQAAQSQQATAQLIAERNAANRTAYETQVRDLSQSPPNSRLPPPNAFDDLSKNPEFRRAFSYEVGDSGGLRIPGQPMPGNPMIRREVGMEEAARARGSDAAIQRAQDRARINGETWKRENTPGPSGLSPVERRAQNAFDMQIDDTASRMVPYMVQSEKGMVERGASESGAAAVQLRKLTDVFGQIAIDRGGKTMTAQEADRIVEGMRRSGYNFEPFRSHAMQERMEGGRFGPMSEATRTVWESIKRTAPRQGTGATTGGQRVDDGF